MGLWDFVYQHYAQRHTNCITYLNGFLIDAFRPLLLRINSGFFHAEIMLGQKPIWSRIIMFILLCFIFLKLSLHYRREHLHFELCFYEFSQIPKNFIQYICTYCFQLSFCTFITISLYRSTYFTMGGSPFWLSILIFVHLRPVFSRDFYEEAMLQK